MATKASASGVERLVEHMGDILLEMDPEGRIHFASRSIERILGYPRAEMMDGRSHWEIWHPDDLSTVLELAPRVLARESFAHMVHRMRRTDGEYRTFESSARRFDSPDGLPRLVIACRDITPRIEEEEASTQLKTRMLSAPSSESVMVLAGGVAHDFGNILQGVLANAELAREHIGDPATSNRRLGDIVLAAERAGELCKQLLAYSGKGELERERLDLNPLVAEMIGLLRASISKKVLIDAQLSNDPLWMDADATLLRQLIMNLVINAAEAIGNRTGRTIVATRREGETAVLEVDDNGSGMDEATLERIFDPFYTSKFTGRGLGLAAVRGSVDAHDGDVSVHSVLGEGTCFTIRLPLVTGSHQQDSTAPSVAQARLEPSRHRHLTASSVKDSEREPRLLPSGAAVLFVDDEEIVRQAGKDILTDAGHVVTLASNGKEALELLESDGTVFDCVVLDLTMPVLDGRETLELIRSTRHSLPVVLCSGYHGRQLSDAVESDPHTAFLAKPYNTAQLLAEIAQAISAPATSIDSAP